MEDVAKDFDEMLGHACALENHSEPDHNITAAHVRLRAILNKGERLCPEFVNTPIVANLTALHAAAIWAAPKTVKFILECKNVDLAVQDGAGRTPLCNLLEFGRYRAGARACAGHFVDAAYHRGGDGSAILISDVLSVPLEKLAAVRAMGGDVLTYLCDFLDKHTLDVRGLGVVVL